MAPWLTNPTRKHEVAGSIPGLAQWVKCRRRGLDPVLLWLWCRPAATALIGPLAWEPPYASGVGLKAKNKQKLDTEPKTTRGTRSRARGWGGTAKSGDEGAGLGVATLRLRAGK